MIRRYRCLGLLCAGLIWLASCDKPSPPPVVATSAPAAEQPAAEPQMPAPPTTQELLAGQYKEVALTPLPFSARVPASWDVKSLGGNLNFLQGPSPTGTMTQIELVVSISQPSSRVDSILDGAKRAAERDQPNTRLCEIRQLGNIKVLEVQRIPPGTKPSIDAPMEWKISYFVPRDSSFDTFVLDVFGLTAGNYEQSKELLRKIIDSVAYKEPTSGA